MKRITSLWLGGGLMVVLAVSLAAGQDSGNNLGDYARQVRKQKAQGAPAAKTFDNDTLPKTDKLSVVGEAPPADEGAPADTAAKTDQPADGAPGANGDAAQAQAKDGDAAKGDAAKEEQAAKQQLYKEWQGKIHSQRDKIDLMTRELDVANREYRLRAASFYADAGNRLRNSAAWDKEDAQYKDQIAAKQKALDDAKQSLEDMQEQARKAGVPSSMRD